MADATDVKTDLLGSTLTIGVQDGFDDRATRLCFVKNVNTKPDGPGPILGPFRRVDLVDAAVATILANPTLKHHTFRNLPLHKVHATKFGRSTAFTQLIYQRRRLALRQDDFFTVADYRGSFTTVEWLHQNRSDPALIYPDKDVLVANPGPSWPAGIQSPQDRTIPFYLNMPQQTLHVPFRLPINPLAVPDVNTALGTCNGQPLQGIGFSFARNTIRFDSCDVRWSRETNAVGDDANVFTGTYNFTNRYGEFLSQTPKYDGQTLKWTAENREIHPVVTWGDFPI